MSNSQLPLGGGFLITPPDPANCFFPEDFSQEHKMIRKTAEDFVQNEVMNHAGKIEQKDQELMRELLVKSGELGLLGADLPEADGGLGLDKLSGYLIAESVGLSPSWAATMMAHIGIGTLPIVLYGNEQQKQKYLPGLLAGTTMGAYCLTEPGAGSDAIGGCRSKAVLSEDGEHYILNGEKIFITNGGWADLFIVFAKIDGAQFSAFIVERGFAGVSSGPEEPKMGLHGSSTTPVRFEDAKIPKQNLLYEAGKGHHIAMNVLNIGRYKLGAATVGGCKNALKLAVSYGSHRQQFGKNIHEFGIIQEKLATMAFMAYLNESLNVRTVGLVDQALASMEAGGSGRDEATTRALREFATECAISKVFGSEAVDQAIDQLVQIHGGYGYVSGFPVERYYRDSRINRIFEGTNEINRLLIPGELLKKAMKGSLPLMAKGAELKDFLLEYSPMLLEVGEEPLAYQAHMVEMIKKAALLVAGTAVERFGMGLKDEQEILGRVADMIIWAYALDSAVARARKALASPDAKAPEFHELAVIAAVDHIAGIIELWGREALQHCSQGDELRTVALGLRKLMKYQPVDIIAVKRKICQMVVEKGGYPIYN